MSPRATLIEIRLTLINLADTLKRAPRVKFYDDLAISLPDYQADGIEDGCRDMAKRIKGVLEKM